jgi:hypothetical protein
MGIGHDRNMGVQPAISSAERTGSGKKTGADLVRARKLSKEEDESVETNAAPRFHQSGMQFGCQSGGS